MKVNFNNINFGYNQKYHQLVQKRLESSEDKALGTQLAQEDRKLLLAEDAITSIEDVTYLEEKVYMLSADYINRKKRHAIDVNLFLGNESYSNELIRQYEFELATDKDKTQAMRFWRKNMINALKSAKPTVENIIDAPIEEQAKEVQQDTLAQAGSHAVLNPLYYEAPTSTEVQRANEVNLSIFKPSASSPKGFRDIVGMDELKQQFKEEIVDYARNPQLAKQDFEEYGIEAPRAFLMYGPPGCGKTYISQAVAVESGLRMYLMDVSKIGGIYVNSSANNLQNAFDFLEKKGTKEKPILLFMDEVDSLARDRNKHGVSGAEDAKLMTTLLKHVESAKDNNIIIIAATNKLNLLDDAFVSRCDSQKYIGLPDIEQIQALIKKLLSEKQKGKNLSENDEQLRKLAQKLEGYSNRSIKFIIDEAAKIAKRDNRSEIQSKHIEQAVETLDLQKIDEEEYKKDKATVQQKVVKGFC